MTLQIKLVLRQLSHGILLVLLVATGAVTPATALDFSSKNNSDFCLTLDKRTNTIDTSLRQNQGLVRQGWQEQNERLRVMTDEQRSSRSDRSAAFDAQRARNLNDMRRHSVSTSQRLAIDTYTATQAQASAARRKSIEAADNSFVAAVKRLVADRQATQAGQVEALRITLDDALQTADGQCAAAVEPSTVEQQYLQAVQRSRSTFVAQRKSDADIVKQVAALGTIRRQSAGDANQTYVKLMTAARHSLQSSLGLPD